ncbi:MAG: SHOCT domain-containing protein [Ilumatobacteraceae bacterium]
MFGKPGRGLRKDLAQNGVRASATVVEIAKRGMSITSRTNVAAAKAILKTTLQVQPPDGSPAFQVRQSFQYSQFAIPSVGNQLAVIYDPADHERIMIDSESGMSSIHSIDLGTIVHQALGDHLNSDPLDQLAKLGKLKEQGVLSDAEFEQQKARILSGM